jgi:hypothetical protein
MQKKKEIVMRLRKFFQGDYQTDVLHGNVFADLSWKNKIVVVEVNANFTDRYSLKKSRHFLCNCARERFK